jgi:hypothetical protein
MPILQDVTITFTAEELLAAQGRNEGRPGLVASTEEAIALGQTLFAPVAIYDEFEVRGVAGERVELAVDAASLTGSAGLTVGPKADLLAPAQRLLVVVYTIGPALQARVGELYRAGEPLLSYMLDCAGVMALGLIGDRVRRLAGEQAAAASSHVRSGGNWGVSPSLSPGSLVGWPVQGQRELCALLPLADIGVRLNKYCVLEPHKSVSMVIGLGAGYGSHEVGSVCDYCALKDSCWRRRRSEA